MSEPKFASGQIILHNKNGYRGVITSVDPCFQHTEAWYEEVARSRPPKDRPWYRVLVHGSDHETYVAERHLRLDVTGTPIEHPQLRIFFDEFRKGRYYLTRPMN